MIMMIILIITIGMRATAYSGSAVVRAAIRYRADTHPGTSAKRIQGNATTRVAPTCSGGGEREP